jgi:pimeloyl-ACP methyl ester carboxylesterase
MIGAPGGEPVVSPIARTGNRVRQHAHRDHRCPRSPFDRPSHLKSMPALRLILARLAATCLLLCMARPSAAQPTRTPASRPAAVAASDAFRVRVVGTGRPIVLVPGLMTGGDVWDGTVAHLQASATGPYQLHVVTLAGFAGVPAAPTDDFLGRATAALIAYSRRERLVRPVVIGHSLGALVAYRMAITAPDLIGGVVAVDGVPFYPALLDTSATVDAVRPQASALRASFRGMTAAQMAQQVRAGAALQTRDTAHVARLVAWAERSDPATVGQAMAEVMTTDVRPQLAAIRAPVLQIAAVGAFPSPAMQHAAAARYAAQLTALPRHELAVAERAHHFVMLDDPTFLHATLDRYLSAMAAAAGAGR